MKVPIRAIGIAMSIFWIFLIVFSVSAFYSLKDIELEFGEPQISLISSDSVLFSFPIVVVNKGYYGLASLNVSTGIFGVENRTIGWGFSFIPIIGRGEAVNTTHNLELNLTGLLQSYPDFFFNDTKLEVNRTVSMRAAEVIPIQVSSNNSIDWGAPLYNFTLGTPKFEAPTFPSRMTRWKVVLPMSFENHAFFDLTGTVHMRMYNSTNLCIGEEQIAIESSQSSIYCGNAEFYIPAAGLTEDGHFELFFTASFFSYGPLVVPYGS